jgi:hypothetical protein
MGVAVDTATGMVEATAMGMVEATAMGMVEAMAGLTIRDIVVAGSRMTTIEP